MPSLAYDVTSMAAKIRACMPAYILREAKPPDQINSSFAIAINFVAHILHMQFNIRDHSQIM